VVVVAAVEPTCVHPVLPSGDRCTTNDVTLLEFSVQLRSISVEEVAVALSPEGAVGGLTHGGVRILMRR